MRDTELYGRILGLTRPWRVSDVVLEEASTKVEVYVDHGGEGLRCPACEGSVTVHDHRERRWRHLDTCQFQTILVARVPRVRCKEHGVKTIQVPWSDPGSGFTALFEALVIDWLQAANTSAVSRLLGLTWDEVDGIKQRAVARGLARRELAVPEDIGVDETSFQKRHEYVTVVADTQANVIHWVSDGRGKESLSSYFECFEVAELQQVRSITMDMWRPFIQTTLERVPGGASKIAFDKFHVAMHLGQAVDKVRREENRQLLESGDESLKGTKYLWLYHPEKLAERTSESRLLDFDSLLRRSLRTARAWRLKEMLMEIWDLADRESARRFFDRWYSWAIRSRLAPMKRVARMIQRHLEGVLNAIALGVTNAKVEGFNTKIQWLKRSARGYRNRDRFRIDIYFHLGGLDLRPHALAHHDS